MEIEFINYKQALELEKLGFDYECLTWYDNNGHVYYLWQHDKEIIPCPLKQQAFKFFREKFNWQSSIEATSDQHRFELGYNYWIWNNKTGEEYHTMPLNRPTGDWEFKTYEEAEDACINKLIEIVKKNKT
jgi:hypothetical protein